VCLCEKECVASCHKFADRVTSSKLAHARGFFAGNEKLIAVPIPAESALTPMMKARRTPGFVTTPWPLNLGPNRAN
jgi:hypothetical protein